MRLPFMTLLLGLLLGCSPSSTTPHTNPPTRTERKGADVNVEAPGVNVKVKKVNGHEKAKVDVNVQTPPTTR